LATDARVASRTALVVTAAVLVPGEQVEAIVQGSLAGAVAILALTDRRVVAANQQDWSPTVASLNVDAGLSVQAWEDEASATVQITSAGRTISFEDITDRPPAYDLVQRLKLRTGQQ
jgi:hypothetical protein